MSALSNARIQEQVSFFELHELVKKDPRQRLAHEAFMHEDAFPGASRFIEMRLVNLPPAELRQLAPGNRLWKDVRAARGVVFGSFAVATVAAGTGAWSGGVRSIDVCVPFMKPEAFQEVLPSIEPGAARQISLDGDWKFSESLFALVTIKLRSVPPGMAVSEVRVWVLASGAPAPHLFVLSTAPAPAIGCALDGERAYFCPEAVDRGFVRPRETLAPAAAALVDKYDARGMFQRAANAAQQSDGRAPAEPAADAARGCVVC